jgi:hypothetical protein
VTLSISAILSGRIIRTLLPPSLALMTGRVFGAVLCVRGVG